MEVVLFDFGDSVGLIEVGVKEIGETDSVDLPSSGA